MSRDQMAERVRAALRGRSVGSVARASGLSPREVRRMREGDVAGPRVVTVERLARALGVSPAWLVWGEEVDRGEE